MKLFALLTTGLLLSCSFSNAFQITTHQQTSPFLRTSSSSSSSSSNSAGVIVDPQRSSSSTTALSAFFQQKKKQRGGAASNNEIVVDPDFKVPYTVASLVPITAALYFALDLDGTTASAPVISLGLFLATFSTLLVTQANRVRCVFDKKTFEFKNKKGDELVTKWSNNYVTGTINKWNCDKTIDFGYFPFKAFPIVVYFRETETGNVGNVGGVYKPWGQFWSGVTSKDTKQIHFFPGFIDIETWEKEMMKRGAKQQINKGKSSMFSRT